MFNFTEGFVVLPEKTTVVGSAIIEKCGVSKVSFNKPSNVPVNQVADRLLNIVHNKGDYYLCRPGNTDQKSHVSLIENYAWLIA